ncbi:MAG: Lrp/AsnC family transcriptional regulator [Candidatus Woesearchaeota archaeon]|nr:Lrp/AsnC family transcriptional regulator [Candidatus Woesearchaeota archaeon]
MKKDESAIICQLRQNARISLTKMSRRTSIPISTIYEKLKSYQGTLVKKYTALIDFSAFGYTTKANLFLKFDREDKENVRNYLMKNPNVNSLYKVTNGYDYLVEGIFRNIKEVEEFLDNLEMKFNLRERQVYYVVDELRREEFLSDSDIASIIKVPAPKIQHCTQ